MEIDRLQSERQMSKNFTPIFTSPIQYEKNKKKTISIQLIIKLARKML